MVVLLAQSGSLRTNKPLKPRGAAGLRGPSVSEEPLHPIDFCSDRPPASFHAPAAIHRSNTNNYTIITSPAAPAGPCGAAACSSGSAAQLAINL